jgi:hypothetical protein
MNKNGLLERVSFVCIDKRRQNEQGVWYAQQYNGTNAMIPHIVHSVPSLLCIQNHNLLMGEQIQSYFEPHIKNTQEEQAQGNGEPLEFSKVQLGAMEEGGTNRMLMASSSIEGSAYR